MHWKLLVSLIRGTSKPGNKIHSSAPVLDLGSHGHEGLFDIGGILCTRLQERDADLVSKGLHDGDQTVCMRML